MITSYFFNRSFYIKHSACMHVSAHAVVSAHVCDGEKVKVYILTV